VNPDGSTADFHAVNYQIVGVGAHCTRIRQQHRNILRLRRGERMVHGVVALRLFVPFQKWEVYHPKRLEFSPVAKSQIFAHLQPQFRKLLTGSVGITTEDQHQIAWLSSEGLSPSLKIFWRIKFIYTGLECPVGVVA